MLHVASTLLLVLLWSFGQAAFLSFVLFLSFLLSGSARTQGTSFLPLGFEFIFFFMLSAPRMPKNGVYEEGATQEQRKYKFIFY